jgi:hypothetical protein
MSRNSNRICVNINLMRNTHEDFYSVDRVHGSALRGAPLSANVIRILPIQHA